ncbi:MAG: 50S ribosomal protein L29 [Bacteroidales bacterium]|nr:50S ribosomal protein L29 [Bacteroidales bacterium]
MKASEIKGLSISEIEEKIAAARLNLEKMKLTHAISPLENPMKIRKTRKDIARMLTILTEKKNTEK